MNLREYYEDAYRSERGRSVNEMLQDSLYASKSLYNYVVECKDRFLLSKDWQGLKVLELGSGRGGLGLQLARLGAEVTLVDFSQSALDQAQVLFENEGKSVKTVVGDVTHPDLEVDEVFDLVVDSHLLHCLPFNPERLSYLQFVSEHLNLGGIFVAETMVHKKNIAIPNGFMFDQNNILWQMFGEWKPVRRILDSMDLEKELVAAGMTIIYFYYYGQYGFVPHRKFMDLPNEILPAAVRFVTQNNPISFQN